MVVAVGPRCPIRRGRGSVVDDLDGLEEGLHTCRGCCESVGATSVQVPRHFVDAAFRGGGANIGRRRRPTGRHLLAPSRTASPAAAAEEPVERHGTVFSGDTRPGKESGLDDQRGGMNAGHRRFVSEKERNVIAVGMQRFTSGRVAPKQPDWVRLSDNVVSILAQNPGVGQLNGTNCYLIGTGPRRILIDAGEAEQADRFIPILRGVMEEVGCEGLQEILITHMHHDHFGCIPHLQELYGPHIPVGKLPPPASAFQTMENLKHHDILRYLDDEHGEPRWQPVYGEGGNVENIPPEELLDWGGKGVEWDPFRRTKQQIVTHYWYQRKIYDFHKCDLGVKYPFHALADDDVLVTQGATLRVLATPGHASDHACFHLKEGNALFSGDHVLGFGTTMVQDMFEYMQSLGKMEALKPDILYPGHGPCIEDATDYLQRYIMHRRDRVEQIFSTMLQKGGTRALITARELADLLYVNTPDSRKHQAEQNVRQNLMALVRAGRAHAYEYNSEGALQLLDMSKVGFNGPPSDVVWGLSLKRSRL